MNQLFIPMDDIPIGCTVISEEKEEKFGDRLWNLAQKVNKIASVVVPDDERQKAITSVVESLKKSKGYINAYLVKYVKQTGAYYAQLRLVIFTNPSDQTVLNGYHLISEFIYAVMGCAKTLTRQEIIDVLSNELQDDEIGVDVSYTNKFIKLSWNR
jgi:hypothetical protein